MDTLTPLLLLAAKNAIIDTEEKCEDISLGHAVSFPMAACGAVLSSGIMAAGLTGLFPFLSGSSKAKEEKTEKKTACQPPAVDAKLVEAVVERVKSELPALIETINNTPSHAIVSETFDTVYKSQIVKAQEFLNENRNADLSRIKCLLHKLLPKEYFDQIEQLREHQDPKTIFNINGGQNIIAPNAERAIQHIKKYK